MMRGYKILWRLARPLLPLVLARRARSGKEDAGDGFADADGVNPQWVIQQVGAMVIAAEALGAAAGILLAPPGTPR